MDNDDCRHDEPEMCINANMFSFSALFFIQKNDRFLQSVWVFTLLP